MIPTTVASPVRRISFVARAETGGLKCAGLSRLPQAFLLAFYCYKGSLLWLYLKTRELQVSRRLPQAPVQPSLDTWFVFLLLVEAELMSAFTRRQSAAGPERTLMPRFLPRALGTLVGM